MIKYLTIQYQYLKPKEQINDMMIDEKKKKN